MALGIIFDMDGTLINSVDCHAKAWREAFRERGHEFSHAAIRAQIGKGGDQLLPMFLSPRQIEVDGAGLQKRQGEILKATYLSDIRPFPGVRALFERLKGDGKRIALASSARKDDLAIFRGIAGIDDLLDAETSSDDAERSKPYPDIFIAALARLDGIAVADVVVVGDTPYDAEAAAKAGLGTIGVLCGGFPEAALRKAGCVAIYRDPADLLAHYEDSPLTKCG